MVTLEKAQIHIGWYNKNIKGNMIAQIYIGKYNKTNKENIGRSIDLHRNVYQEQQRKHGKQHRFRQEGITKITKETRRKAQNYIGRYTLRKAQTYIGRYTKKYKRTIGKASIQIGRYNKSNKQTIGKGIGLDRTITK